MEGRSVPGTSLRKFSYEDPGALISEGVCYATARKTPKVAVIGAGPAGLAAARQIFAQDSGLTGVVFEHKSTIGGTWVYTDEIGRDKFGQQIHSPLYHDLITNLPKEVMEFTDFPYDIEGKSYLTSHEVLDYLNKYASHFNLLPHIKLNHLVKRVAPVGKTWSITALDLESQTEHVSLYDAVMVCSGPTSIPVYPTIEGLARFSGKQLHAKSFRRGDTYKGQRVLVIGLGPSGLDIAYKILPHAKQVVLSHKFETAPSESLFAPGMIIKPAVVSLIDTTVTFVDGSTDDVDVVIHCTGYTYNFPFLTKDCGLVVNQYVSPLYHHLFNIEAPSMAVLGLLKKVPFYYCVEFQAKAFLAVLRGEAELPTREEMLKEYEEETQKMLDSGLRKKDVHMMGKKSQSYIESLQKLANVPPLPGVRYKIFSDAFARVRDFAGFRYVAYKILDDENFELELLERPTPKTADMEVVAQVEDVFSLREQLTGVPDGDKYVVEESSGAGTNEVSGNSRVDDGMETVQDVVITEEDEADVAPDEDEVESESQDVVSKIEELKVSESPENTVPVAADEPFTATTILTIQSAMNSSNQFQEIVSESSSSVQTIETSSSETMETSSSEIIATTVTRRIAQETVILERDQSAGNTIQVEAVVENSYHRQGETVEKCEKILNGEQLSEGMVSKSHQQDESIVKQR